MRSGHSNDSSESVAPSIIFSLADDAVLEDAAVDETHVRPSSTVGASLNRGA